MAPELLLDFPAGQLKQEELPLLLLYLPALQLLQSLEEAAPQLLPYFPAGQLVHDAAPLPLYVPALQLAQGEPELPPSSSRRRLPPPL